MRRVFETYFEAVDGRPNAKGGKYRINLLPTTVHVYFGSVIGATPDGRRAGFELEFDVDLKSRGLVYKRFWIVQTSDARLLVDSTTANWHPLKLQAA